MSFSHGSGGYAIWALPDKDDERALSDLIGAIGHRFPPHVTILQPTGHIARNPDRLAEALHKAMDATMLQRAIVGRSSGGEGGGKGGMELVLLPPQAADAPMAEADTQAVLSPVDPHTAASLVAMRTALCQTSGDDALPYAPHLTLLYGDLDQSSRQQAANYCLQTLEWPRSISISEVAVASIQGPPEQWEIIARVRLE